MCHEENWFLGRNGAKHSPLAISQSDIHEIQYFASFSINSHSQTNYWVQNPSNPEIMKTNIFHVNGPLRHDLDTQKCKIGVLAHALASHTACGIPVTRRAFSRQGSRVIRGRGGASWPARFSGQICCFRSVFLDFLESLTNVLNRVIFWWTTCMNTIKFSCPVQILMVWRSKKYTAR